MGIVNYQEVVRSYQGAGTEALILGRTLDVTDTAQEVRSGIPVKKQVFHRILPYVSSAIRTDNRII